MEENDAGGTQSGIQDSSEEANQAKKHVLRIMTTRHMLSNYSQGVVGGVGGSPHYN